MVFAGRHHRPGWHQDRLCLLADRLERRRDRPRLRPHTGASVSGARCSASPRRAIFPRPTRPWPSGFPGRSARLPPASTIPGPTSAPSSRRCASRIAAAWGWEWAFILTGAVGLIWLVSGTRCTTRRPPNWPDGQLSRPSTISSTATRTSGGGKHAAGESFLGPADALPADLGFCDGQIPDRPVWWFFLFWLPAFLAGENTRKAATYTWPRIRLSPATRPTFPAHQLAVRRRRRLHGGHGRFDLRRLAAEEIHQRRHGSPARRANWPCSFMRFSR